MNGTLLFVYSDLAGSLWVNRFDLDRTAGELRSAIYTECLKDILPPKTSSAQLNIFYMREGVAYEPEDTFKQRLRKCMDTYGPQKIGCTTELSQIVGEMKRGHVHFVIGFPDRPLVTAPTDVRETVFESAPTATGPALSLARVEETQPLDVTVGSDDVDACSTDGSSRLSYETQPSEMASPSSSLPGLTDYLELLSPSFAYFMSLMRVASFPEDEAFMARASRFAEERLFSESADLRRAETLGSAFIELLQPAGKDVFFTDYDGIITLFCRIEHENIQASAPLLVFQAVVKSSPTEGSDAVRAAIHACDETWTRTDRELVHSTTCCPLFAVTLSGSSLSVYGSAITHKWVYHDLTLPRVASAALDTIDSSTVGTLTHLLWTLRQSVSHLQEWYRTTILSPLRPQFYDRLHPATTSVKDTSGAVVGFYYVRRLEPHDKVFLAFADRVDDCDREFVVKFTPRYSAEAHRLLSAANCAPDLIYCGSPYPEFPGYTRMQVVITEYVPSGLTMWEVARKPLRDKLREAVGLLHSQGMVHGDLRWPNVLVNREGDIRLIDFDWAGLEGVARYPDDLAEDVPWPVGAKPGALITKDHDKYWLERLFKPRERV